MSVESSTYSKPTLRSVQEKLTSSCEEGLSSAALQCASAERFTSTPHTAATTSQSSCFSSCTSTSSVR